MDISEYEEMKKNATLLEASLKRETELSSKIDKLNQEKIEAMEQAQKSVTIITKTEINEYLHSKIDVHTAKEIITQVARVLNDKTGPMSFSMDYSPQRMIEHLAERLFTKEKITSVDEDNKTIVFKGLDEVKEMIREEFSKKFKLELEDLNTLRTVNEKLRKQNQSLTTENDIHLKNVKALERENKVLKLKLVDADVIEAMQDDFDEAINSANEILQKYSKESITIWNYKSQYKKLSDQIIKSFENIYNVKKEHNGSQS